METSRENTRVAGIRRSPAGAGLAGILLAAVVAACGSDPITDPPIGPSERSTVRRLVGTVHEAGNRSNPVIGASVEVVGGTAAGMTASTDWFGGYSLTDVPGDADIRVRKDGYEPVVVNVSRRTSTPGGLRLDVPLAWAGAPAGDVSGSYTLTVSADCAATSELPAALRTRRYTATIARRNETEVEVRLGGADFEIEPGSGKGDWFAGRLVAEGILFTLEAVIDWGPHPSVLERVPNGWLEISGRALVRHSATGLSGTLNGSFTHYPGDATYSWYVFEWCASDTHQIAFSR